MKTKILIPFIIVLVYFLCAACHLHRNRTEVSIQETAAVFQMKASFNEHKTRAIATYINENLRSHSTKIVTREDVEETVILDDDTKLYVQSYPGSLKIKFNKNENSAASFDRVKNICHDLKMVITQ